jgi:hypothetical protein
MEEERLTGARRHVKRSASDCFEVSIEDNASDHVGGAVGGECWRLLEREGEPMRSNRLGTGATMVGLAIGSAVLASVVYTEDFESGYNDGDNLSLYYPEWWASSSGVDSPVVEYGNGVAGSVGLGQHSRAVRWNKHAFDFSDPNITGVVMSADFETVWEAESYPFPIKTPFDDDYLGWMTDEYSTSSNDIFGVYLEGNEIRTRWRIIGSGSSASHTIGTLSDDWNYLTFYRLRIEYSKVGTDSVRMDVSVTELDDNGMPGNVIGTAFVDVDEYNAGQSYTKQVNLAQLEGPMWLGFKNFNSGSPGNLDNIYLEIIPEPGTAILLACAGLVLLKRRRA